MSGCINCGAPTPNRRCRDCELADRFEADDPATFDTDTEAADDDIRSDGSGCFFCGNQTDYHPTCDRPGCTNQTHGHGPEGKTTMSYCSQHRTGTAVVTDGGREVDG